MTSLDDITKGTSAFNYAIRHPHKSGTAFTVMPRRGRFTRWTASIVIGSAVGTAALGVSGHLLIGCVCGIGAGFAVSISDGWAR